MKISDIKAGLGKIDIVLVVKEKGEERTFNKFDRAGRVANAICSDETGATVKLTLWNDDVDKVAVGDEIHLTNGYASEFKGEIQLSTGKFGKMEVKKSNGTSAPKEDSEEASEEDVF